MTLPALTLPTTAPMTHNALKQRAAQKLATDRKPVHEFLPRLQGSIAFIHKNESTPAPLVNAKSVRPCSFQSAAGF